MSDGGFTERLVVLYVLWLFGYVAGFCVATGEAGPGVLLAAVAVVAIYRVAATMVGQRRP